MAATKTPPCNWMDGATAAAATCTELNVPSVSVPCFLLLFVVIRNILNALNKTDLNTSPLF